MTDTTSNKPTTPSYRRMAVRCLSMAALLLALAMGVSLGVRTISSPDIGYHLAYGDTFFQTGLQTGRIVDSSPELYTLDSEVLAEAKELPPGAWIDEQGVYRFPNANWASQVLFSYVHRIGGVVGLGVLQIALVAGVLLAAVVAMRRLGAGFTWAAVGVVVISLTAYERFMLRPELVGYFVLAVQFCLLSPAWRNEATLRWWRVGVLVVLQLLLVNLHSYWLLGLGMTLAGLAGATLNFLLPERKRATSQAGFLSRVQYSIGFRLAVLLGLEGGACFANPWTWRLAALPVQTLWFFSRHRISDIDSRNDGHPWSVIGEFCRPWESPFADVIATKMFCVVLALVLIALVYTAVKRRWSVMFLLVGMTAMSLSMRRNIAPGAILLTPAALVCVVHMLGGWNVWKKFIALPAVPVTAAVVMGCLAGWLIGHITSNNFYYNQHRADRFGFGISQVNTPVLAARWLSENQPVGRIWTDYDSSSNLYYFTQLADPAGGRKTVHPNVPILTNTWAYPPEVMQEVLDVSRGLVPVGEVVKKYGVEVVALRVGRFTAEPNPKRKHEIPLALELSADPNWTLVHLDAVHAIFLRKEGLNRALAFQYEITPDTLDLAAYVKQLTAMDPVPAFALYQGGKTLSFLGWNATAIRVLQKATEAAPNLAEAWYELGICHARLGRQFSSPASYQQAERCILQSLHLKPDFPQAIAQLQRVRKFHNQLLAKQKK